MANFQFSVMALQIASMVFLAFSYFQSTSSVRKHIGAPLHLRGKAIWTAIAGIMAFLFLIISVPFEDKGSLLVLSGLLATFGVAACGFVMMTYKALIDRAAKAVGPGKDYKRLELFRLYAEICPGQVWPLLKVVEDVSALRILSELHEKGYMVEGRPLGALVAERVKLKGPEAIERASRFGFFDDDPSMLRQASALKKEMAQAKWEAILERREGAPRVGNGMRSILEEAIARQEGALHLRFVGQRAGSHTARSVLIKLQQHLREMCEAVGLTLVVEHVGEPSLEEPLFCLEVEAIQNEDMMFSRETTERVEKRFRRTNARGHAVEFSSHESEFGQENVVYPVLRLRGRLLRRGRKEAEIEVDSRRGLSEFNPKLPPSQGRLLNMASEALFPGMVRGLGLRVEAVRFTLPTDQSEAVEVPVVASARGVDRT